MMKVSVIVPVYNTETYLGECLDSFPEERLRVYEMMLKGFVLSSPTVVKLYRRLKGLE